MITFYRILNFLLLVVAGLLLMAIFLMLPAVLSNPQLPLRVFAMICLVIYSYSSWIFLQRAVDRRLPCKPFLRDLIRVNAIVSIVVAVLILAQGIIALNNPTMLTQEVDDLMGNVPQGADISREQAMGYLKTGLKISMAYGAVVLVHTLLTFRLLKLYRHMFKQPEA
ncbi:MAG: hypothetical protein P0Y53_25050 [Candidatus Pseudobacter hemicellulosilyticus]|uniref:Uncharacterized protein n=1 Tax=Candidatus Pseudobacter hemicellulosilyticus TaxID=3121375 RepID=A0AAJ6BGZ9_9BACT|nr:MAG: hypothetical protein P0Y53_25050 [Pseudobacter sp.]